MFFGNEFLDKMENIFRIKSRNSNKVSKRFEIYKNDPEYIGRSFSDENLDYDITKRLVILQYRMH